MKTKIDKNINICIIKMKVVLTLSLFKKIEIVMHESDEYTIQILKKWAKTKNMEFSMETRPEPIYIFGDHFLKVIYTKWNYNILHFKK